MKWEPSFEITRTISQSCVYKWGLKLPAIDRKKVGASGF